MSTKRISRLFIGTVILLIALLPVLVPARATGGEPPTVDLSTIDDIAPLEFTFGIDDGIVLTNVMFGIKDSMLVIAESYNRCGDHVVHHDDRSFVDWIVRDTRQLPVPVLFTVGGETYEIHGFTLALSHVRIPVISSLTGRHIPSGQRIDWRSDPQAPCEIRLVGRCNSTFCSEECIVNWAQCDRCDCPATGFCLDGTASFACLDTGCQAMGWVCVFNRGYCACICVPGTPSGCPYLFSWVGDTFAEENNLLPSSEHFAASGVPSCDYYKLKRPLRADSQGYRLQIGEFEEEHSFFDTVRLLRIDHSPSVRVAVASDGRLAKYRGMISPRSAVDQNGYDHLAAVMTRDGNVFRGSKGDELTITFESSDVAHLASVVRGGHPVDLHAVISRKAPVWFHGDGSIIIQVPDLRDPSGIWKNAGAVHPRALWDDFIVDLRGQVKLHDLLQVRLVWATEHHLDEIGFLIPSHAPVDTASLPLRRAEHSRSGCVLDELRSKDEGYAEILPGEEISLVFGEGTEVPSDLIREFVFFSRGYYIGTRVRADAPARPEWSSVGTRKAAILAEPSPLHAGSPARIEFSLPEAGRACVVVYDTRGRRVTNLLDEFFPAGTHESWWDGRDDQDRLVAPGIFLLLLSAEGVREITKLTILP